MSDTTTSEQLAEIEGQAESTPVTGYTPPEGWRVVQVGEVLRDGDLWVNHEGELWPTKRVGERVNDERYIRRIQVREGRWRTRSGDIRNVTPTPEGDGRKERFPWWDAAYQGTWTSDGRYLFGEASPLDLFEYIGPIESELEPQAEPQPRPAEYTPPEGWHLVPLSEALRGGDQYSVVLNRYIRRIKPEPQAESHTEQQIEELRSEVSYVQRLLGESRQRVTQLEELVASLRTINRGCENAVRDAGKENFALKNQLEAVKAELAQVSKDRYALQSELDAAQQVPADSPELRQLRADLEQVTRERDQYLDSYQRIFGDLETIRETTKAAAVEAIAEWLQAFRGCNSPSLALLLLEALPSIMRSLVGLADDEEVD